MPFPIHVRGLDRLNLISPVEPDFDDLARPLLGRVANLALRLKPFLVIVSNESAQAVVSFSKMWRVNHKDGRVTTFLDHASFPHAVCGDVLVSRDPSGLAPGERRIEANGLVIHGWGDLDEYYDQFLPQFVTQKDRTLANAVELQIELNAVIWDDGTLLGPDDQSWLSDNFSAYVQAKQNWYRGIIGALDAGQTVAEAFGGVEQFLADLTGRLHTGWHPFRESPMEFWNSAAAYEARRWRRRYADADIPRLLKEAIHLEPFVIRRRSTEPPVHRE